MRLSKKTKVFLSILMVAIYGIQIAHTIVNKSNWPFSPHNFYFRQSLIKKPVFRFIFKDDKKQSYVVESKHILPIEGYRIGSIIREVYVNPSNNDNAKKFSQIILDRLNNNTWVKFDERYAPAIPLGNNKFIEFKIERHILDLRNFIPNKEIPIIAREMIYEYKN
jgi:hypothetical protein